MIVTKLEQQEYNVVEKCSVMPNVHLTMKKNNCNGKFIKQMILVYLIIRSKVQVFLTCIMGQITLGVL